MVIIQRRRCGRLQEPVAADQPAKAWPIWKKLNKKERRLLMKPDFRQRFTFREWDRPAFDVLCGYGLVELDPVLNAGDEFGFRRTDLGEQVSKCGLKHWGSEQAS